MPHPTAVRITDAALDVLGTGGIHALSHARVDRAAGLPPGSTSNYFRTRAGLITAAVERLRHLDAENFRTRLAAGFPATLADLISAYAVFVDDATGPSRVRTVARYVIFTQAVVEPALLDSLNADRRRIVDWTTAALNHLDVPDPEAAAALLWATIEGLLQHRLSGFSTGPAEPDLRRLLTALSYPAPE